MLLQIFLVFSFLLPGCCLIRMTKLQTENTVELIISSYVLSLGSCSHGEMHEIIRNADTLVLSSYWEGVPTVVLEAMASGTLLISTPVGYIPRFVGHLDTGMLIDRSLGSFQEAVSTVLDEEEAARSISRNARGMVERDFSIDKTKRILEDLYSEMSESHRGSNYESSHYSSVLPT